MSLSLLFLNNPPSPHAAHILKVVSSFTGTWLYPTLGHALKELTFPEKPSTVSLAPPCNCMDLWVPVCSLLECWLAWSCCTGFVQSNTAASSSWVPQPCREDSVSQHHFLSSGFYIVIIWNLSYVYGCLKYVYFQVPFACLMPVEGRQGNQIPSNLGTHSKLDYGC